jgi:hypothetical protein
MSIKASGPQDSLDDISDGSLNVVGRESLPMVSEERGRGRTSCPVPLIGSWCLVLTFVPF